MQQTFEITLKNRNILAQILQQYTPDQLNKIPVGFNNNVIWNIGHIIVTQQRLAYRLSGLGINVPPEMDQIYKRGTKPERYIGQQELDIVKSLLFEPVYRTRQDLHDGIFKSFTPFVTMSGFELKNVREAIEFNNYHEAIHVGVIMSIIKFI